MSLLHWQQQMLNLVQGTIVEETALNSKESHLSARIQAYSNNYQGGLTSFLKITYPQILSHLGQHNFDLICRDYIAKNPMVKNAIDEYGDNFPIFLENQISERVEMKTLGFLPDVARLDWAIQSSYYDESRINFDVESFAKLDIEEQQDVQLLLAQDIYLIASHWPLEELWQYHEGTLKLTAVEYNIDINWVMVERKNMTVSAKKVTHSFAKFFSSIKQGATLSELVELDPDLLPHFISSGLITGFRV